MLLAHPILKRIEVDGGERHTEKEKVKKKKKLTIDIRKSWREIYREKKRR